MKELPISKIFLLLILCLFINHENALGQTQKVWLDADTGNETDDVYAIVRLLNEPSINLIGLSSAHFNNADLVAFDKWNQYSANDINTVKISQQLNEEILNLSGKSNISHPIGADRAMGRAWGGSQPRNSEAAKQIIAAVKTLLPKEKLHIICLGALTNIASAIAIDSTIADHIKCYLLGAKYNIQDEFWDKNEFNIRNDLNAFDYLLNTPSVQLIIMPVTTAEPFKFERDKLYTLFNDSNPALQYMAQRWADTNPNDTVRTLWDVALVEAYLNPVHATIKMIKTPPENVSRSIGVYIKFDNKQLINSYLNSIQILKKS
ncbi:nucleoside hydrolase [Flavobacterium circumlabens]|uniref:Inosine-uridine nucleoside N-ribohydrolase n=1 Tax=Flavobacterium circumlabens TaxID=2133765 RepID=A0A4Y7UF62_9FLAO|nr:nucleoside hydrolase [Flavobacterium circumlabens]TCN59566.1 inosine-uridine nucleoside N-ribohydrolase [Flavobacterium circumlabens]TEB44851.1 nucleoside hydrolase [Flavobacterium circumlabens]